jgi:hypothetical protein
VGEKRNAYKVLLGNPYGKRLLVRPRNAREDNIKLNLKELGWEGVDLIHVAQDRKWQWRALVNILRNRWVP